MQVAEVLQLLLGAGGLAFFGALWKAIKDWREGSWKQRQSIVADLERWRDETDAKRKSAEDERDAWRAYAGRCEHALFVAGVTPPAGRPGESVGP